MSLLLPARPLRFGAATGRILKARRMRHMTTRALAFSLFCAAPWRSSHQRPWPFLFCSCCFFFLFYLRKKKKEHPLDLRAEKRGRYNTDRPVVVVGRCLFLLVMEPHAFCFPSQRACVFLFFPLYFFPIWCVCWRPGALFCRAATAADPHGHLKVSIHPFVLPSFFQSRFLARRSSTNSRCHHHRHRHYSNRRRRCYSQCRRRCREPRRYAAASCWVS